MDLSKGGQGAWRSSFLPPRQLTIEPGKKVTIKDNGAYGLICVQGEGKMNKLRLNCPKLIRFHDITEDEVFCTEAPPRLSVTFENTSATESLVVLRYFGPEVNPDAPGLKYKGDVNL